MIPTRMPSLFLAHGNPMNAIEDNAFTRALAGIPGTLPRPTAIVVVSAHWLTDRTEILGVAHPPTIHDFDGFPRELYEIDYPAPGAPDIAAVVGSLLPEAHVVSDWGLDHAAWTVLRHMWPEADVPVLELSLDMTASAERHWELGRKLAPLRDQGVLVVGSGNIVHSFAGISWEPDAEPSPWALEFDAWIADALTRRDTESLTDFWRAGIIAERPA